VVSGDFYWSAWVRSRQGNRKIVFATADCTGHGVPGAFMSMIGANLLAQVVSDRKVTEPDMILTLLHGGIRNLLRQQRTKNRDGIDISINVIDWNAKTLVYSGAKRIQRAILPEDERINSMIPQNFVFFRPRDVVSGDFYWCTQSQKGEKVIFATADCTGHGVPGAFMSMIGTNLLTQIVNDHHITKPDVILHLLDERVRQSLQQDANKNRDGMDISISVIDWETKTLTYSGAKRPLYYIQHGEMHQIKGSRYAVGGYLKGIQRKYTTQEICFAHAEITAYTFSDGFPDQIGEKSNRKFMIKHFRELLFELSDQPLEVQKQELAQIFDEWKGSYFQLDDVLVVGMRLS